METIRLTTTIGADGTLRIEAPCGLPPGPADVVVLVRSTSSEPVMSWADAYGLGQEIWDGVDAQTYVNELRDEWER